jgi:thiamine-phosphate pyrophosphorylase
VLRYAITDRLRLAASEPARRDALLDQARQCAASGVDFLQLREKDLPARDLAEIARGILAVLRAQPMPHTRLLINGRADVALACHADGVHVTSSESELNPDQITRLYAAAHLPPPLTSISCHSLADVTRARALVPSVILFGPVFEKVVSDPATQHTTEAFISRGTGINLLRTICAGAAPIPVLALGGITEDNAPDCLEAGAAGIAAIRLFNA